MGDWDDEVRARIIHMSKRMIEVAETGTTSMPPWELLPEWEKKAKIEALNG